MKTLFLVLIAMLTVNLATFAQMGIGGMPSANSILDLRNSGSSYLILPATSANPDTLLNDNAAIIYHNGNIYMKTSQGIKVFTPWNWDGDTTHNISSPVTANVGFGADPPDGAPYLLQVADAHSDVGVSSDTSSILVGRTDTVHLLFDNDEIMAKSNLTTVDTLVLQEEAGSVTVRSVASDAGENTVLTAFGSVDTKGKVKENGNDLIPVGIIMMWSGTTVPPGWALCDGGTYMRVDGTAPVVAPNLIDKFVIGTNIAGIGASGGNASSSHTHTINPANYVTATEGTHNHSMSGATTTTIGVWCIICDEYNLNDDAHTHSIDDVSSTHSHSFNLPLFTSSDASDTENRPPYYTLAYIIKL